MENSEIFHSDNHTDSLCWNCKRCTGRPDYPCSWAQDGIPVEGWTAEKGKVFSIPYTYTENGELCKKKTQEQSYFVMECPLYIRDKQFSCLREVFEAVAQANNVNINSVYKYKRQKFKNYEKLTGNKIPLWAWDNR